MATLTGERRGTLDVDLNALSTDELWAITDTIAMCLAEAGYPIEVVPHGGRIGHNVAVMEGPDVPWPVFERAQEMALLRLGIPFKWVDSKEAD